MFKLKGIPFVYFSWQLFPSNKFDTLILLVLLFFQEMATAQLWFLPLVVMVTLLVNMSGCSTLTIAEAKWQFVL